MKVFFDNNLSPLIAAALAKLEPDIEIQHLRDKFDPATLDEVWIPALAAEGDWIVISGDMRISTNPKLRATWLQSQLIMFFLANGWMKMPMWENAWRMVKWWPTIKKTAGTLQPPAAFQVPVKSQKLRQLQL